MRYTSLLICIALNLNAYSQDTIMKTNGELIICKIIKENNYRILYNFQNIDYTIQKIEVSQIKYKPKVILLKENYDKMSLGIGIGQDLGGIGLNVLIYPQKNVGIFGGFGYVFAGVSYNAGTKIRILSNKSDSKISTHLIGMYGYNASFAVMYARGRNKIFYGFTTGIGIDYRPNLSNKNYWTISVLYPIRKPEVNQYYNEVFHSTPSNKKLFPLTLSLCYRIGSN